MMVLANNIRVFRELRGLSQRKLAEKMDKAVSSIANWEKDMSTPDVTTLVELCKVLKVTPNEMLGWDKSQELADYIVELEAAKVQVDLINQQRQDLDKRLAAYMEKFKGKL